MVKAFVLIVAAASVSACQADQYADARSAVAGRMNDPQSTQFQSLRDGKDGAVCGSANAKNQMGGYGPYQNFAYLAEPAGKLIGAYLPEDPFYVDAAVKAGCLSEEFGHQYDDYLAGNEQALGK